MKNTFAVLVAILLMVVLYKNKPELKLAIPDVKTVQDVVQITSKDKKQIECLTHNIYYEAGYEQYKGQLAVAMVTLRRAATAHYPKTLCGVVKQKTNQVCQFSWWCDEQKKYKSIKNIFTAREKNKLEDIRAVATYAFLYHKDIKDDTGGALFYHNTSVDPGWNLKRTTKIGNHIFYRKS